MDPSYNNNNPQYYPPPQQNYPSQQAYPTSAYRSPPTQQASPPADPYQSHQQGYPPTDPYQSPQQGYPPQYDQQQLPQIPNPTQNLDQLNEGWFLCYMVALGIVALLGLMGLLYSISLLSYGGSFVFVGLLQALLNLSLLGLVVIQLLAMKDRDLQKAKIALIGFLSFISINIFLIIISFFASSASTSQFVPFLISIIAAAAVYGGLTLIGSFKVYQLLNENQIKSLADIYQNQNQDQNQNYYQA